MDLTSDFPFWTVQDGLIAAYPPLDSDARCEALVIGGGISGALLAHRLVSKNVDTILVDRRDIGHGSTSASTALLQYEIDTPLHRLRRLVGEKAADRAYWLGIESISRLRILAKGDCGFAFRPSLQIANNSGEWEQLKVESKLRRTLGFPVQLLGKEQLKEYGFHAQGAIRSEVAAEVNPYCLTHRLLRLSVARGLRVFDRTKITHYSHKPRSVIAHSDRKAVIRCKSLFFATGYETNDILPAGLVKLRSTYAIVTEPAPVNWWRERAVIWGAADPYIYARTTSDNRIIFGGADDYVLNAERRDRQLPQKTLHLVRKLRHLCPQSKPEPAFSWAGTFASTPDGLAYIGAHPSFPRAYFALGFGGNGITFGEAASRILTDLFLGRRNPDAQLFRFDR